MDAARVMWFPSVWINRDTLGSVFGEVGTSGYVLPPHQAYKGYYSSNFLLITSLLIFYRV